MNRQSPLRAATLLAAAIASLTLAAPARAALTPTITERALAPSSHPVGLEPGPDGALWITQWSSGAIGRMTLAGVTTPYALPTPDAEATAITTGPDGNLWVAESQGNAIARITPTGTATEFPLPTAGSAPASIVAGPDGQLWFTERAGARIGHMKPPAGAIAEITLASGAQPQGIDVGADGNLWVALSGTNAIARVTTGGAVTTFPVPTPSASPFAVAAGPDGNVWFTERNAGRIGRITPSGTITEFPLPSASSAPTTIAAGPDGALWFAETTGNAVGRITVTGAIEEYSLTSAGAQPGVIALGPDGNLWLTESARDAVARITTPPAIGAATAVAKGANAIDLAVGIGTHAQQTTVSVEYGPIPAYGSTTAVRVFNSTSNAPVSQSWSITGLNPGTEYHLRVVATNATGTVRGPDIVVATAPGPPVQGGTPLAKAPSTGAAPSIFNSPLKAPTLGKLPKAPPAATLVGAATVRVVAGRAPMTVSCPATAIDGCRGTIVLRAAPTMAPSSSKKRKPTGRASRCARGCRPLGQAKFDAKAGKRRRVSVKLSAAGRSALARAVRVKARATVATVIDGRSTTVTRTVTLRSR
jgi:virginiamycin B lyase